MCLALVVLMLHSSPAPASQSPQTLPVTRVVQPFSLRDLWNDLFGRKPSRWINPMVVRA